MESALEHILTNNYKDQMIQWMDDHPEAFDEAVNLAVSDKPRYSWRAAWLLWSCMEKNDQRVQPFIQIIISSLHTKNDDHQRELLKILLFMELSEEHEGVLFDLCANIWEKIHKKPSVRFNALKMILKITKHHPDLSGEVKLLLQDHYLDSLSLAARKSIDRLIRGVVH